MDSGRGDASPLGRLLAAWPAYRQLTGKDGLGRGIAARSAHTEAARPRTASADRVVRSVCPYCAVGCGQQVYVSVSRGPSGQVTETVTQIEGDPDSPVSRGRLCPKGAATKQLVTHAGRQTKVLYRRPYGTQWEPLGLDEAMEMIAERVLATRRSTWQEQSGGKRVARTLGIASLGGATLDNEENYLIKKLWTALGAIQIENQARI
jgi:formate dehydrogenase major subunit